MQCVVCVAACANCWMRMPKKPRKRWQMQSQSKRGNKKRGKDKNVACMLYTIYFSLTLFLFVGFVGCGVGWLMILNPVTILKMLVGQTLCLTNSASCCNSLIHECGLWTLCSNNLCSYPQLVCRGAISVLTLILLVAEAGCPNNCTQLCSLLTGYNRPA